MEREFAGLAHERLQSRHVLDAGHLHENALAALTLNDRLGGAKRVNTPANCLDRCLDCGTDALPEGPAP